VTRLNCRVRQRSWPLKFDEKGDPTLQATVVIVKDGEA
jgi:hypothetical protein